MRVWDTRRLITRDLGVLDWRSYLAAMWVLCSELRSVYAGSLTESEQSLMAATLDLVRSVVMSQDEEEEVPSSMAGQARGLAAQLEWLIEERESQILSGHWNLLVTFESLAAEVAGTRRRYGATQRLTLAATEYWRELEPAPGLARKLDHDEEIDDAAPMAQALVKFERVVTAADRISAVDYDPVLLRAEIFDE